MSRAIPTVRRLQASTIREPETLHLRLLARLRDDDRVEVAVRVHHVQGHRFAHLADQHVGSPIRPHLRAESMSRPHRVADRPIGKDGRTDGSARRCCRTVPARASRERDSAGARIQVHQFGSGAPRIRRDRRGYAGGGVEPNGFRCRCERADCSWAAPRPQGPGQRPGSTQSDRSPTRTPSAPRRSAAASVDPLPLPAVAAPAPDRTPRSGATGVELAGPPE